MSAPGASSKPEGMVELHIALTRAEIEALRFELEMAKSHRQRLAADFHGLSSRDAFRKVLAVVITQALEREEVLQKILNCAAAH